MTQKMSQILSDKEKQSIEELRSRLSDELKEGPSYSDDYSLLRWLIGWDYNIGLSFLILNEFSLFMQFIYYGRLAI